MISDGSLDICNAYKRHDLKEDTAISSFHRYIDSCLNHLRRKPAAVSSSPKDAKQDQEMAVIEKPVTKNTPSSKVLELMRQPNSGLNFYAKHNGIPDHTFLAYDAVNWVIE